MSFGGQAHRLPTRRSADPPAWPAWAPRRRPLEAQNRMTLRAEVTISTLAHADERASGPSVGIRASPSVRVGGSRSNAAAFTTSK
jgi:hypothetical protein